VPQELSPGGFRQMLQILRDLVSAGKKGEEKSFYCKNVVWMWKIAKARIESEILAFCRLG
jgi:hypothetical protein